jgi:hypothetical protein
MQPYNQKVDVAIQVLMNSNENTSRELIKVAENVLLDYLKEEN